MVAIVPDLLRVALVPTLGWLAVLDVRTRRVPRAVWWPLFAVAGFATALEVVTVGTAGLLAAGVSVAVVGTLAAVFWALEGVGRADAKALAVLAVAYPWLPAFHGGSALPLLAAPIGPLSLTVVTNAALLGCGYALALGARNAVRGHLRPAMVVARPVAVETLTRRHGTVVGGVDLDDLDAYLEWRKTSVAGIRSEPAKYRFADEDPWRAAAFVDSHDTYGATAEELRQTLETIADSETVWVAPGIPFLALLAAGLVSAIVLGDLAVAAVCLLA